MDCTYFSSVNAAALSQKMIQFDTDMASKSQTQLARLVTLIVPV